MELLLTGIDFPLRLHTAGRMSREEFLAFSANNDLFRMEMDSNGDVEIMTPASTGTGRINNRINGLLWTWAEADGRGEAYDADTGFTMPDGSVRAPDGAWCSLRRYDQLSAEAREGYARLCPEFIFECARPPTGCRRSKQKWRNGFEMVRNLAGSLTRSNVP